MNIRAVMASLDIYGIDHMAKVALTAVACRADQHTGEATVSIGRIAADVGAHYDTARRALVRLVEYGYLSVVDKRGMTPTWKIDLAVLDREVPRGLCGGTSRSVQGDLAVLDRDVGVRRRKTKEAPPSTTSKLADDGAGDNGRAAAQAEMAAACDPAAIAACNYCDDFGWLWRDATIRGRCSHRPTRAVTALTVDDVLADIDAP
jgi:hypothetical protein